MKILIAEPLAPAALELLRAQQGWNVVVADPKTYDQHLPDCEALLVRSAVKVTKEVLARAPKLRVIGRAGVGVDNVDLPAATEAGVLVMNTPGGNAVSVAEHTLALMLSMARSIPAASFSTKAGKWEKKKFLGNELRGKTLGIIGLGAIGREVLKRAKPFEMRVLGYDPYVSPQSASDMGVELMTLPELYAQSDFLTLHVALTPETDHMLNADAFSRMKEGIRIVNCARGELIDIEALGDAIKSGKVAGASLDVFEKEPPGELPLFSLDPVLATPHIAGSTEEAQEIVGIRIVEQMVEYLKNGVALNAVNMPAMTAEQYKLLGPYVDLAERLGFFLAHIATGQPATVRLIYDGRLADGNTQLLRNAGLAGILSRSLEHRANVVNAMQIATERGLRVVEQREAGKTSMDAIRMEVETNEGTFSVSGALVLGKARLLQVESIACEVTLDGNLLYSKNDDIPGTIGFYGTVLGKNGINIANFALGRQEPETAGQRIPGKPLTAISIVETDGPVSDDVVQQLFGNEAIRSIQRMTFPKK
jgi:D-3-phosphoglycerate dehydrogenase / 2-oxoglutarate reductase